jgi:plastocyanin
MREEDFMSLSSLFRVALASVCIVGCSGGGGDSTGPTNSNSNNPPASNNPAPSTTSISVMNNAYSPTAKTIAAGTTVQWNWSSCTGGSGYGDEQCVFHSVTFDDGAGSELQNTGSYNRMFTKAGTYAYHCSVHGAAMSGTITVQ